MDWDIPSEVSVNIGDMVAIQTTNEETFFGTVVCAIDDGLEDVISIDSIEHIFRLPQPPSLDQRTETVTLINPNDSKETQ